MTRESEFTDKCNTCGKYGVVRLKRIKKKPHNPKPNPKPEFKTKKDYRDNPYDVRINRIEHPYRYLGVLDYFCGLKPTNRPIIINPPKSEPRASNTSQGLHKIGKILAVVLNYSILVSMIGIKEVYLSGQ
jgi:hypothetical protein